MRLGPGEYSVKCFVEASLLFNVAVAVEQRSRVSVCQKWVSLEVHGFSTSSEAQEAHDPLD